MRGTKTLELIAQRTPYGLDIILSHDPMSVVNTSVPDRIEGCERLNCSEVFEPERFQDLELLRIPKPGISDENLASRECARYQAVDLILGNQVEAQGFWH